MCRHRNQTIIYHEEIVEDELFDFTGWQCDDCGMLVNREISDDDVMRATHVAKLDVEAYTQALDRALKDVFEIQDKQQVAAIKFMQAASAGRVRYAK